jgi:hypothetical protein
LGFNVEVGIEGAEVGGDALALEQLGAIVAVALAVDVGLV